jgi:hypothetical protein
MEQELVITSHAGGKEAALYIDINKKAKGPQKGA